MSKFINEKVFSIILLVILVVASLTGQSCTGCTITVSSSNTNISSSLTSGKDKICITGNVIGLTANNIGR